MASITLVLLRALKLRMKITNYKICQNISDREICGICSDSRRKKNVICLVEDPRDVAAIEKLGEFDGVYHVLGGVISPLDGKGPEKLKIAELLERIKSLYSENGDDYKIEVIAATNPTVEGEATAMYGTALSDAVRFVNIPNANSPKSGP